MGLVSILAYVGDSGASDERDRLYSLLGVSKDSDLVSPLDPKASVEDVYTALVKSFIEKYNSLDIICYCHIFNKSARESNTTLPTWVPDWRVHVEGKVIPVMASQGSRVATGNFRPTWVRSSKAIFKASGDRNPVFAISGDSKTLTCSGLILDKVDGLGGSQYNDNEETAERGDDLGSEQSTSAHNQKLLEEATPSSVLMEIISRCIALDREDRYLAKHMAPSLFKEPFIAFSKAFFSDNTQHHIPRYARDWFTANKSLIIQGRTLETHHQEASLRTPVPSPQDFKEGPLKDFYKRLEDTVVTMARRLTVTEKGYLGMAACRVRKGDLICVLFGCSIPVLLREREGDSTFEFIGECYLDGFMNGEAIDEQQSRLDETRFQIV